MALANAQHGMRARLDGLANLDLELYVKLPSDLSHINTLLSRPEDLLQQWIVEHLSSHTNFRKYSPVFFFWGGAVHSVL